MKLLTAETLKLLLVSIVVTFPRYRGNDAHHRHQRSRDRIHSRPRRLHRRRRHLLHLPLDDFPRRDVSDPWRIPRETRFQSRPLRGRRHHAFLHLHESDGDQIRTTAAGNPFETPVGKTILFMF